MLTEKDYCDYELRLGLRDIGYPMSTCQINDGPIQMPKITLYEAQKFLREEKNLHITIFSQSQESWQYRITKPHQKLEDGLHGEDFSSFEEALLEGVREAVKILKGEVK